MLFTNMTQEPYDNDGYHFMTVNGIEAKSFGGDLSIPQFWCGEQESPGTSPPKPHRY